MEGLLGPDTMGFVWRAILVVVAVLFAGGIVWAFLFMKGLARPL